MWTLVKKYWDLLSGFIVGLALSIMSHSGQEIVRLIYSVVLIFLVSIGVFRLIRKTIEKRLKTKRREHTLIDDVVDNLPTVKAVDFALEPIKQGKKASKLVKKLWEETKNIMKKLKQLFDKYKGILLSVALMVLTLVEDYGGYINQLCGGKLVLGGYEIIPIITLVASVIVGIISNGFTKEQNEKIKALFSKSSTDELIQAEIKKTIKERSATLSQYNKILSTKEAELENLQSELETRENSYNAKKGMYTMTPQLATEEDVKLALNAVQETTEKIENKKAEIEECKETIANLTTTINALKSQL